MTLYTINHPFVMGGAMDMRDYMRLVMVLSRRPSPMGFSDEFKDTWLLRLFASLTPLYDVAKRFEGYLKDFWNPDDYKRFVVGLKAGKDKGLPWPMSMALYLHRETNLTNLEIWCMPMGLLEWHVGGITVQMTDARIATESVTKAMDASYIHAERQKKMMQQRRFSGKKPQ